MIEEARFEATTRSCSPVPAATWPSSGCVETSIRGTTTPNHPRPAQAHIGKDEYGRRMRRRPPVLPGQSPSPGPTSWPTSWPSGATGVRGWQRRGGGPPAPARTAAARAGRTDDDAQRAGTLKDCAAAYAEALARRIGLSGERLRTARPVIVTFIETIIDGAVEWGREQALRPNDN